MKDPGKENQMIRETLELVSPGTLLYEGLENILRARTGALIIVGDSEEVMSTRQRRISHRHRRQSCGPLRAGQDGRSPDLEPGRPEASSTPMRI